MLDCFKNVRESRGKRKRAAAREELAAEAETIGDEEQGEADAGPWVRHATQGAKDSNGRAVVLYILDPINQQQHPGPGQWDWNEKGAKMLGVIYEPNLNELNRKVSIHLPAIRKVSRDFPV